MGRPGTGAALDRPFISFALQHILHVHAGARRAIAFRLKVHGGRGFIFLKRDGSDAHIHRQEIGALGQVIYYSLPDRLLVVDTLAAADEPRDR